MYADRDRKKNQMGVVRVNTSRKGVPNNSWSRPAITLEIHTHAQNTVTH